MKTLLTLAFLCLSSIAAAPPKDAAEECKQFQDCISCVDHKCIFVKSQELPLEKGYCSANNEEPGTEFSEFFHTESECKNGITDSPDVENDTTVVPTTTSPPHSTTTEPPTTTLPTTIPTTSSATSTTKPTASPKPAPPGAPSENYDFHAGSFLGGIALAVGCMAIGAVAWKFYKARTERNYHTL